MSDAMQGAEARSSGMGRFIWYELNTDDVQAAMAFYTKVVGWSAKPFGGDMPYFLWEADGVGVGGTIETDALPPQWLAYIWVDDVDGTLARVLALGGRLLTPATDIPGVGRFGMFTDPQGAWLAVLNPTGEERAHTPNRLGHVGWNELHTTDSAAAWKFYSELFGWQPATSMDMGELGTYSIFRHPADPAESPEAWLGGMSDTAKHMDLAPRWLYYVNVAAIDAAIGRVTAAGGKLTNGPMEVPGGRAAQCLDPQGAEFAIFAAEQ